MGSLVSKPKLTPDAVLPPAANPPVFANIYSQIAGSVTGKKKGATAQGFGGTVKNSGGAGGLAEPMPTATPSLLG